MRKALALVVSTLAVVVALAAPATAKPELPSCEQKTDKKSFDCDY